MEQQETVEDRLLTIAQAAKIMEVAEKNLRAEIAAGRFLTVPWGKQQRIPRWYLKEWQKKRLNEASVRATELAS